MSSQNHAGYTNQYRRYDPGTSDSRPRRNIRSRQFSSRTAYNTPVTNDSNENVERTSQNDHNDEAQVLSVIPKTKHNYEGRTLQSNRTYPSNNYRKNMYNNNAYPHNYAKNRKNDSYRNVSSSSSANQHNCGYSSTNQMESVTEAAETDESGADSSIGMVVNGRYVRRSKETESSSLNPNVEPFVPSKFHPQGNVTHEMYAKENGATACADTSASCNTRQTFSASLDFLGTRVKMNSGYRNRYENNNRDGSNRTVHSENKEYSGRVQDNFFPRGTSGSPKHSTNQRRKNVTKVDSEETVTQRDRLISQLSKGDCECMVCCESIRVRDLVWSCSSCYHIFHLRCIKKWARAPTSAVKDSGGWRCPACQNICENVPYSYFCFCGKMKDPEPSPHYTPHSCGEICGKQREQKNCIHNCNLLCHPGPCPTCHAIVNRPCECGKTTKMVACGQSDAVTCSSVCGKTLNCTVHECTRTCHAGDCLPCATIVRQHCFCGKSERDKPCSKEIAGKLQYSCDKVCAKVLSCQNHSCTLTCHPGSCPTCRLLPYAIVNCPCGKDSLISLYNTGEWTIRTSCTDPIPVCGKPCEKVLQCGPKDNPHRCKNDCHIEQCPPCPLVTAMKCQCGSVSKDIPCKDISSDFVFRCEKRCNRRKDCGRHKCLNHCCTNYEHKCELVCQKKLSCGQHFCSETCHGGKCPLCGNVSFDELYCHCGHSVLYPPIHCGTKPPECNQPCVRPHPCDHKVQHTCHSDDVCPPCTVLTTKWCFGHHEKRGSVQCFLDGISCGKPCNKPLSCGRHNCNRICHPDACVADNGIACNQVCGKLRPCGHTCAAKCHDGECPDTPCKAKVTLVCPCGHRSESALCSETNSSYHLMSVSLLATKIQDIKAGESVDLSDILGKKSKANRLQCNEECAIIERNKRLAIALQINNPDLSCKPGPPNYSEFLKEETRKNLKFVSTVYDKFTELVQLAKQSKQKSRSHAFPPMNREQRRIIHELAPFFGCETQSYDEEPVKNVVITAFREKSWLPFVSITSMIQREMGVRKGPTPVISHGPSKPVQQTVAAEKKEKTIDYFDYVG